MAIAVIEQTGKELRKLFHGPLGQLIFLSLLIVPILYGALYLWAFLDPYGKIDQLPVALVNLDKSYTTSDGTVINGGADAVKDIKDSDTFKWEETTAEGAKKGMEEGKYFMSLTIPSTFSERIGTANTDDPVPTMIYARSQLSNNFLTSQIGERVFVEIRAAASESISKTYYKEIFKSFADSRSSLTDARDGAKSLHTGLKTARDGAGTLANGTATLGEGTVTLKNGTQALVSGAGTLKKGTSELHTGLGTLQTGSKSLTAGTGELASKSQSLKTGTKSLDDGIGALAKGFTGTKSQTGLLDGSAAVASGIKTTASSLGDAKTGADKISAALASASTLQGSATTNLTNIAAALEGSNPTVAAQLKGIAQQVGGAKQYTDGAKDGADKLSGSIAAGTPQMNTLVTGANSLKNGIKDAYTGVEQLQVGSGKLDNGATALVTGTKSLDTGANQVYDGVKSAKTGAGKLDDGATTLKAGVTKLDSGASDLESGAKRLEKGATQLHSGLRPAVSGSLTLYNGLRDGVKDIPDYTKAEQTANASMMSNPVHLSSTNVGRTKNYGTGFAPYFLPLALWVGALIGYLMLDPLPGRRSKKKPFGVSVARTFAGYVPMATIGLIQSAVLILTVQFGLGVDPVYIGWFWAILLAGALCYTAILQFLNSAFGPIGKLFAIIFLMLQLTSAAGTFPIELQDRFFQVIHPFMPMSYLVAGLRGAVAGGPVSAIIGNLITVVIMGLVFFLLTLFTANTSLPEKAERLSKRVGI